MGTTWLVIRVKVHPVDLADHEQATWGGLPPSLARTHEPSYRGAALRGWATQHLGLGSRLSLPAGLEVIMRRWVVERTFAQILRN